MRPGPENLVKRPVKYHHVPSFTFVHEKKSTKTDPRWLNVFRFGHQDICAPLRGSWANVCRRYQIAVLSANNYSRQANSQLSITELPLGSFPPHFTNMCGVLGPAIGSVSSSQIKGRCLEVFLILILSPTILTIEINKYR